MEPPKSTSQTDTPFDAIVVGSGAGGAPLAAQLAERGWHVLVIEAGPDQIVEQDITDIPVMHGPCSEHPEVSWQFFVKHYDRPASKDPKADLENDGNIFYPRATGIGGCTAHNAMVTIAGPDADWDELAWFLDDTSWRADTMRTYFERVEQCEYLPEPTPLPSGFLSRVLDHFLWLFGKEIDPTRGRHGFHGWLHTSTGDLDLGLKDNQLLGMLKAAFETSWLAGLEEPTILVKRLVRKLLKGGAFHELDPNHSDRQADRPEGVALIPTAIYGPNSANPRQRGHRSSPRERLRQIKQRYPENLVIATDCLVTRILLEKSDNGGIKATGVEYLHGPNLYEAVPKPSKDPGTRGRIHAKREVILSGGAFNTPQLLMLSGIGPEEHLTQVGINPKELGLDRLINSPGVGKNLQDRYEVTVVSKMKSNFSLLQNATLPFPPPSSPADENLKRWRNDGSGLYASNGTVLAILKRSRPHLPQPNLFIFGIPLKFVGYYRGYSKATERDMFTWAILKSHTSNRDGRVLLESADPKKRPRINFHYFQEVSRKGQSDSDPDLQAVVDGIKFVRKICARAPNVLKEEYPGTQWDTDAKLKELVKRDAWGHHACGTCRMGRSNDPEAVLDSQFRVLDGVRESGRRQPIAGLRVVDASIFWKIPGFFIVTNIYMASEKAADTIWNSWH